MVRSVNVKYAKNIATCTGAKETYEEEERDSVQVKTGKYSDSDLLDQDLSKGDTSNTSVLWAIHRRYSYTMNRDGEPRPKAKTTTSG
jgi:hypothetical protein